MDLVNVSRNGRCPPKPTTEQRKTSLVQDLKSEYDRINQEWQDAEKWLNEIPVCSGAWITIESDEPFPDVLLGYLKAGGDWQICIGIQEHPEWPEEEQNHDWKSIHSFPIEFRESTLKHLNALKEAVLEEGERFVAACRKRREDEPLF